jgi:hypothetical protein
MIKSILALADGAAQLEATLRTAGQAARRLDAQLDVIAVGAGTAPAVVYAGEYSMPEPLLAAAEAARGRGPGARLVRPALGCRHARALAPGRRGRAGGAGQPGAARPTSWC